MRARRRASGAAVAGAPGLEVLRASDDAAWAEVLRQVVRHDFHHLAGYHRVAEWHGEGTAHLFAYRDGPHLVAVPLLIRPIDVDAAEGLLDATSVYGYCGPVASSDSLPPAVIERFQAAVREELVARGVVSVFSRLHPLIEQAPLLDGLGEVRPVGLTVSIDLTLAPELQWAGYGKSTRRLIRRAREAGVTCFDDESRAYQRQWVELYRETMRRVGAPESYLFDAAYFERLADELGPVLHLFVAVVDGEVAAAGLYTLCDGIVQAHLGGLRAEHFRLSPTRLLDDTVRLWAIERGATVFHLGGGVGGQQDSLFGYKAGFSDRRHVYRTWRWIVDPDAYRELSRRGAGRVAAPDGEGAGDWFPAYRRPGLLDGGASAGGPRNPAATSPGAPAAASGPPPGRR